ncbi:hypothetical protein LCGC14_1175930, partial [marine sediment metagenome]
QDYNMLKILNTSDEVIEFKEFEINPIARVW